MALSILSLTLLSSSAVAVRAFQVSQTSGQRSTMAFAAQGQMERVRAFRDNHTWTQFLDGNASPAYYGVLSAATTSGCRVLARCFHMTDSGGTMVPVSGSVGGSVPDSYLEIMSIPEAGASPQFVRFEVAWGFAGAAGGPENRNNILTELVNLKSASVGGSASVPTTLCTIHPPTLIVNGNFKDFDAGPGPGVNGAARFTSDLPNRGNDTYPDDNRVFGSIHNYAGGFSIQHGPKHYVDNGGHDIFGIPFPGDPSRGVPGTDTDPSLDAYFYSNPNESLSHAPGPFSGTLWRELVTGLTPNTTYYFVTYFYNLLPVVDVMAADPLITLLMDGASPPGTVPTVVPKGAGWMPVETQFTTGPAQTSVTLSITDTASNIIGDDFGMAAASLYLCD